MLPTGFITAAGGVLNHGDLAIIDSRITKNTATADGFGFVKAVGGIWNAGDGSALSVIDSKVTNNTGIATGVVNVSADGGITNAWSGPLGLTGSLTVTRSVISGIHAATSGTGLGDFGFISGHSALLSAGDTTIERTTIKGNSAVTSGTGVVGSTIVEIVTPLVPGVPGVTGTLDKAIVRNNTAEATGLDGVSLVAAYAGLVNLNATVLVERSTIRNNEAIANGGAETMAVGGFQTIGWFFLRTSTEIDDSVMRKNSAIVTGGASGLAVGGGANGAPGFGEPSDTAVTHSTIKKNAAETAAPGEATGGAHDLYSGLLTVMNSKVKKNTPNDCNFAC